MEDIVFKYKIDDSDLDKLRRKWGLVDDEQDKVADSLRLIALNTQKTASLTEKLTNKQVSGAKKAKKENQSLLLTLNTIKNTVQSAFIATGAIVLTEKVFSLTKQRHNI